MWEVGIYMAFVMKVSHDGPAEIIYFQNEAHTLQNIPRYTQGKITTCVDPNQKGTWLSFEKNIFRFSEH